MIAIFSCIFLGAIALLAVGKWVCNTIPKVIEVIRKHYRYCPKCKRHVKNKLWLRTNTALGIVYTHQKCYDNK